MACGSMRSSCPLVAQRDSSLCVEEALRKPQLSVKSHNLPDWEFLYAGAQWHHSTSTRGSPALESLCIAPPTGLWGFQSGMVSRQVCKISASQRVRCMSFLLRTPCLSYSKPSLFVYQVEERAPTPVQSSYSPLGEVRVNTIIIEISLRISEVELPRDSTISTDGPRPRELQTLP